MFQFIPVVEPGLFAFRATGKLTDDDYQKFLPQLEELIETKGPLSLLMELEDFHGWDAKAAWDDFQFGTKYKDDILRIAIVGEKRWQRWMTALGSAFGSYEIRYFDKSEVRAAWRWVRPQSGQDPVPESPDLTPRETDPGKLETYQHILVAQDFSSHSRKALSRALELARLYGAKVSLIHAVESVAYISDSLELETTQPNACMEIDQTIYDNAVAKLTEIAENLDLTDVQTAVLWGTPKSTILSYAEAQNADLIVVGSHGRHGLAKLLGSTASALSHSAGCDVLVVKSPASD